MNEELKIDTLKWCLYLMAYTFLGGLYYSIGGWIMVITLEIVIVICAILFSLDLINKEGLEEINGK